MFTKFISAVLCCIGLMVHAEANLIPFTNNYEMRAFEIVSNEEVLSGSLLYERAAKNYTKKNYTKFYEIMHARLAEAKKDGTWDKYVEYHQNILFKQPGRIDEKFHIAQKALQTQRNFKLLALCQENPDLTICKIIRNLTVENEGLEESSSFLKNVLCGNVVCEDLFLKELYEILIVQKFYFANLMFKEWMEKKVLHQLFSLGLNVNNTSEALLIINLEVIDKMSKLAAKNPQHPASKYIQEIFNHQLSYLSKEYDRSFLLEIALGRRSPRNDIEKKAAEIELEFRIKLKDILKS
ncbi:MAG: hypothetical protein CK425_04730 [Parachlamydia sp.]|nr:MAG: hypothetical protein CK425_04730 [Parachlamydia sp.]